MGFECYLCGTLGASRVSVDYGNRQSITCVAPSCGDYVITNHAIRRLEEGGPNKEVLCELVRRANSRSRVLDIFVAEGLVQSTEIPRNVQVAP